VSRSATSTARGALVGIGTVVLERGVVFVVVLVLARTLAPETFGRYGYLLAGMTLVQVIADQGIEVAAVAAMAAAPAATHEVVGAVLLLRALVWACVAVPVGWLLLPAFAAGGDASELASAGLAASGLVLVGSSITMRGVLRARGAMGAMARVALADAVVGGAAVIVQARAGAGITAIFATRVLASMTVTAVAMVVGGYLPRLDREARQAIARLVRVALPLGGNALLIAVHTRAGHLVAMAIAGPSVVGLLGVAARLTEVLGVLPEGALLALFPRMAAGPAAAPALAAEAARRLSALALGLIVMLAVGATPIVVSLFGAPYAAAGPAVATLAWIALLAVTGGVTLHALVARGAQRVLLPANLGAAVLGVGLQVVLIRAFGVAGAALATVLTAAAGQLALALAREARPVILQVWRAVLPLVAVAGAVIACGRWLAPTLGGGLAAAAAYVLVAGALGLVGPDDWRVLRRALAPSRAA
jgi:O-antigen/teichoic acid export membrane protein